MKNWILAGVVVAVLGFFALETPAQETLKVQPGKTVTKSEPMPAPVGRTGLFRRFQERRGIVTTVVPSTPTTVGSTPTPTTPTPTPTVTTQVIEPRTGIFSRLRSRMGR